MTPLFPPSPPAATCMFRGLADGATEGDIIIASSVDPMASIPTAICPTKNSAALVTGYSGAPQV